MSDSKPTPTELVQRVAKATTGRTVCPACAEVLLVLLDAVRKVRAPRPEP